MNRQPTFVPLLLTLWLFIPGCVPRSAVQLSGSAPSEWTLTRLLVRNEHSARVDVFLVHGLNRVWVGRVERGQEGYFDLDAGDLTEALANGPAVVRLEVKPWGPQFAVRTDPVRRRKGQMID
jgi:hypothetical protein